MSDQRQWHTSSRSANGGECIEVREGRWTDVRDTKNRDQGYLSAPAAEWVALLPLFKT